MATPVITPEVLDSLYQWLRRCADKKQYCPTNQNICDEYGFKSMATSAGAIKRLELQGRIKVIRFNRARQVHIIVSGECTAPPPPEKKKGIVPVLTAPPKCASAVKNKTEASPPEKPEKPPAASIAPKGRQCQWIEGEPTPDDSCKCLTLAAAPGEPYCPSHKWRSTVGAYVPKYFRVDNKKVAV